MIIEQMPTGSGETDHALLKQHYNDVEAFRELVRTDIGSDKRSFVVQQRNGFSSREFGESAPNLGKIVHENISESTAAINGISAVIAGYVYERELVDEEDYLSNNKFFSPGITFDNVWSRWLHTHFYDAVFAMEKNHRILKDKRVEVPEIDFASPWLTHVVISDCIEIKELTGGHMDVEWKKAVTRSPAYLKGKFDYLVSEGVTEAKAKQVIGRMNIDSAAKQAISEVRAKTSLRQLEQARGIRIEEKEKNLSRQLLEEYPKADIGIVQEAAKSHSFRNAKSKLKRLVLEAALDQMAAV